MSRPIPAEAPAMPAPWFRAHSSPRQIEVGLAGMLGFHYRPSRPEAGERQLGKFVLPAFQRGLVWTDHQQVRFIESVWDGLPLGTYVVNSDDDRPDRPFDGWLLDGQQRWHALSRYAAGELKVYGARFPDIRQMDQLRFLMREFTALVTELTTLEACREVYERLAYGGTPHEAR